MTEDLCHAEGLGLLPGVIVKGQDLRGDSLDPDLRTRRATARSPEIVTETDFPMTGFDPPLLSTRILVTTVVPSAPHVTDIETISEKITFLTRGGLGPLSPGTDPPMIMTKLRSILLDREGPYLQSCPQGAEGRDPHLPGSGETGLARSADPGGHDHQSHPTLQMAIMSNTERPRGMASSHRHQLLRRKLSKRIYSMQSATYPTGTFLMTLTTRSMFQQ